jgi:hypothetical protein
MLGCSVYWSWKFTQHMNLCKPREEANKENVCSKFFIWRKCMLWQHNISNSISARLFSRKKAYRSLTYWSWTLVKYKTKICYNNILNKLYQPSRLKTSLLIFLQNKIFRRTFSHVIHNTPVS